jgi:hypothetical protein
MKKLYVSPSRSSLLAAIDICGHPAFASAIVSKSLRISNVFAS